MKHKSNTYVYEYHNNIYINLTNKCTSNCEFCVRNKKDGVAEDSLWLKKEPTVADIMEQMRQHDVSAYSNVVYCGYGEPTIKLDVLIESAKQIKEKYNVTIRINTNGHANLYHEADITPMFAGLIDEISISLNQSNAKAYDEICHSRYGLEAFEGLLDFAKKCKEHIAKVTLSIVDILPQDVQAQCKEIAKDIGVTLRIRKYIS